VSSHRNPRVRDHAGLNAARVSMGSAYRAKGRGLSRGERWPPLDCEASDNRMPRTDNHGSRYRGGGGTTDIAVISLSALLSGRFASPERDANDAITQYSNANTTSDRRTHVEAITDRTRQCVPLEERTAIHGTFGGRPFIERNPKNHHDDRRRAQESTFNSGSDDHQRRSRRTRAVRRKNCRPGHRRAPASSYRRRRSTQDSQLKRACDRNRPSGCHRRRPSLPGRDRTGKMLSDFELLKSVF